MLCFCGRVLRLMPVLSHPRLSLKLWPLVGALPASHLHFVAELCSTQKHGLPSELTSGSITLYAEPEAQRTAAALDEG
jgi:hypothetical protein